jgi:hypothetical protein
MFRTSAVEQNEIETDKSLDGRQLQAYNPALLNNRVCQDLEVVDACRGTSIGRSYIGKFEPFTGECDGRFYEGLPTYFNNEKKLYMYAIDKYPDDWSSAPLRGLIRWRIASFQKFEDRLSCRREEANIFQIDFASDVQPYNYYPTIFCFDSNADDSSGFKVSTITIICNDIVVTGDSGGDEGSAGDPKGDGGNVGIIIAVVLLVIVLGGGGYYYWKRQKERGRPLLPFISDEDDVEKGEKKEKKNAKREAKLEEKKRKEEEKIHEEEQKKTIAAEKAEQQKQEDDLKASAASFTEKDVSDEVLKKEEAPNRKPEVLSYTSDDESMIEISPPKPITRTPAKRAVRRMSIDPPAKTSTKSPEDEAVPSDIRKMVARLDNFFTGEVNSKKPPVQKRPVSPPPAVDCANRRTRSRSVEPDQASQYANKDKTRSRSLERSRAADYANKSRSRAPSKERAKADDYADRGRESRSRSIDRSKATEHPLGRARDRGRSVSKERSKANDFADKRRPRSVERSGASDFADKRKPRSRSLEPANASTFADKKPRGRSVSKKAAPKDLPVRGRSKSGRAPLDASKAARTVTKQDDGSVIVSQKRTREDGALVTTKTKYATIALARKHGVEV